MESAIEPHVHNFPRTGNGCYCGAQQCGHQEIINKGKPLGYLRGSKPALKKRCKNAVAGGSRFCQEHSK